MKITNSMWDGLYRMNSPEDKELGIKGWLSGKVPKTKQKESKTGQVVLDKHRIAVLPFVNMTPDPADEYFADGITEEIISTAAGISGLRVISRTSVMRYKKTEKAVKEIGRELEVGSVLEGSFRKAGNRIRVTTQLINVADDEHLWAQNYDRNLDDIFAVQSDVAKQVAEALRVRILSPENERIEKKPTESTTAYSLYLRGRYHWNKRGPQDLKKAMECFELAVREDPSFALGYVGQADCAALLRSNWNIDLEENLAKAKAMAERALQLDPALAEAHTTLGLIYEVDYNLSRAEEEYRKAMEYFEQAVHEDPSFALGYVGQADCAVMLRSVWNIDREENLVKAKAMLEKALQIDSTLAEAHTTLGFVYNQEYDLRRAEEEYRRAIELKPSYATAHQWYFWVLLDELRLDEALKEIEKAVELDPLSGLIINNLGQYYYSRRDYQNAAEKFKIGVELGFEASHGSLFWVYGMMKMYDEMEKEAEAHVRLLEDISPRIRTYIDAYRAYFKGDKETVRRLLPELEAHPKETFTTATEIAGFHFFLGDVNEGFEWLERAYSKREMDLLEIQYDWFLDGVRTDPRYLDLLKRLGLCQTAQPTN